MDIIRVDLHVHSCYSPDSLSTLEEIIDSFPAHGMDKIALTDHNTIQGALSLQRMRPDLVIVGQEIKTTAGELIAYFVDEEIPRGLTPEEAIRRLTQQGAVIGVSHPLDRLRREALGYDVLMEIIHQIDCLETFNARVMWPEDNRRAEALAERYALPATAGSDAHSVAHIGRAYVEMPAFSDRDSFVRSLEQGRIHASYSGPGVHLVSTYAKVRRRLLGK